MKSQKSGGGRPFGGGLGGRITIVNYTEFNVTMIRLSFFYKSIRSTVHVGNE